MAGRIGRRTGGRRQRDRPSGAPCTSRRPRWSCGARAPARSAGSTTGGHRSTSAANPDAARVGRHARAHRRGTSRTADLAASPRVDDRRWRHHAAACCTLFVAAADRKPASSGSGSREHRANPRSGARPRRHRQLSAGSRRDRCAAPAAGGAWGGDRSLAVALPVTGRSAADAGRLRQSGEPSSSPLRPPGTRVTGSRGSPRPSGADAGSRSGRRRSACSDRLSGSPPHWAVTMGT